MNENATIQAQSPGFKSIFLRFSSLGGAFNSSLHLSSSGTFSFGTVTFSPSFRSGSIPCIRSRTVKDLPITSSLILTPKSPSRPEASSILPRESIPRSSSIRLEGRTPFFALVSFVRNSMIFLPASVSIRSSSSRESSSFPEGAASLTAKEAYFSLTANLLTFPRSVRGSSSSTIEKPITLLCDGRVRDTLSILSLITSCRLTSPYFLKNSRSGTTTAQSTSTFSSSLFTGVSKTHISFIGACSI